MDNQPAVKGQHGHGGKIAALIILIVAIAGICIVSIIRDRIVNYPQWTVSVTGQGKIAYSPDVAKVTLGVQIDKVAKAEDALSQLNSKIAKVVAAIKAAGIAEADITTQNYSLYTQYDYVNDINKGSTSVVSGYNANEQVLVKITDVINNKERLNKVIAEASQAGANQVLGIYFEPSNLEDLKQQARVKAMADARGKAQSLAGAAGVRLKKVVGWWENVVQAPGINTPYYDGKGGMGGGAGTMVSPTIPTGSQEIIIEESINYQLK
jgi:hypothetical protein